MRAKYFSFGLYSQFLGRNCTSCHIYYGTRKYRFVTLILGRREYRQYDQIHSGAPSADAPTLALELVQAYSLCGTSRR
jgi:hypothetical protein